jgi:serine/threonine protein kinase/tetratricopeptide (TPR) repeat protein
MGVPLPATCDPEIQMTAPTLPQRYSIASLLGEGGQGRVYRVHDSLRDRTLALKLVSSSDTEFLRREFDTLRQIRHENLIQVFDWGTLASGDAYYTMELVEGEDWGRAMGTPQDAAEVRRILTGLLRGLAHLHCHGEIHGDLKPGNILLGRGGVVKVTDVGMGAGRGDGVAGTPGYTAPECWEGKPSDVRADLYSVGVMAYEALTGKHPFGGRTIREVVAGQIEGWVASPGAHRVKVPADLERVIMRALERDPSLRQGSADEFMEGFGVDDRVGVILGGRFGAREEELQRVLSHTTTRTLDSPTLVTIAGQPGSGRTSLLSELSHRVLVSGGHVLEWDDGSLNSLSRMLPSDAASNASHDIDSTAGGVSLLAADLARYSKDRFMLITVRPPIEREAQSRRQAVALARYLSTVARESQMLCSTMLVYAGSQDPEGGAEFEVTVHLSPLEAGRVRQFIEGLLGACDLEDALVERVAHVTSGVPSRISRVVLDLAARKVIARRNGRWRFLESEHIREIRLDAVDTTLSALWGSLDSTARGLLLALDLVPTGLSTDELGAALSLGVTRTRTALDTMATQGLTVERRGLWLLGPSATATDIELLASEAEKAETASRLLSVPKLIESDETSAWLRAVVSKDARAALVGAQHAAERRDYGIAARRALQAEAWATDVGDDTAAYEAVLARANALHQAGSHTEARRLLESKGRGPDLDTGGELESTRNYLLGRVCFELGDLPAARAALQRVVETKNAKGSTNFLSAHATLAEIDWRHGDGEARNASILRLQEVLDGADYGPAIAEQRASLTYQVGAAMIEAGKRKEARQVLQQGLERQGGAYWHMRIRNALATIAYYEGDFRQSLALLDESWKTAESSGFDHFKARVLSNRAGLYYGIGKFRDATEQHRLSALWARRMGSTFEYLAACLGESVNLTLLARYEGAIESAREARKVALSLPNHHEFAKACELEALALHCIGDDEGSADRIREANGVLEGRGFDDVKPRLDWLSSRIHGRQGNYLDARRLLDAAEAVLMKTTDWEDLPGVQIEIDRLAWRSGSPSASLRRIADTTIKAEASGAVAVVVRGCLVLAEILADHGVDDPELHSLATRGLAVSEEVGTREFVWRISASLGRLALRRGERELGQQRLSLSVRVLREVAGELSDVHRQLYLATPHARSLLTSLQEPSRS